MITTDDILKFPHHSGVLLNEPTSHVRLYQADTVIISCGEMKWALAVGGTLASGGNMKFGDFGEVKVIWKNGGNTEKCRRHWDTEGELGSG